VKWVYHVNEMLSFKGPVHLKKQKNKKKNTLSNEKLISIQVAPLRIDLRKEEMSL